MCCGCLSLLVAAIVPAQAQTVTVTDENGIVYDIVDKAKMTVKVSATNATQLASAANPKDVVIPATVTDHSTSATTTEPWTVIGMADRAFQKAAGLRSITIEAPLTEITQFSFNDCANLESVTLPETVKSLGQHSFSQCPNLKSIAGIDNVITIASYAFYRCSSLTDITLPSTLTLLQGAAFQECTSLERITIPGSVKELQASTFQDCTSLAEVILEEGVQIIGQRAFEGCSVLVHPTLPASLKKIYAYAFKKCDNLGTVTIKNLEYMNEVYAESTIQKIEFPKSEDKHFVVLGAGLFQKVKGLTEVTVKGYTEVPAATFQGCPDLTTVTLTNDIGAIRGNAFAGCKNLATVNFSPELKYIGGYAFEGCTGLTAVTLPAIMTRIDNFAFNQCSSLSDITLPAGAELGTCIFNGCDLQSITFPAEPMGAIAANPFGKQPSIKKMTIPGWMTTVPEQIFYEWTALAEITFSEGVEAIGATAACGCLALETIILPSTLKQIQGINRDKTGAFQLCNKLANIRLTAPGENGEARLLETNGKFPDALTEIGHYAFSKCKALVSVTLPDGLESIGENAFDQCSILEIPSFPESLKSIGGHAFSFCKADGTVTLHKGMRVGDYAFAYSSPAVINLPQTISSEDEKISFGWYVFKDNNNIRTFTFPDWMDAIPGGFCQNWRQLETIILPAQLSRIEEYAFSACGMLHDVALPPTIKYLDKFCFSNCGSTDHLFGSITLYEGTKVDESAFQNTYLTEIIFEGCAEFGKNVFYNVTTIQKIAFPSCMETIPEGFCQNWKKLTEVTIPEGVKKISKNVFAGCEILKSITIPASLDSICDLAFFNSGLRINHLGLKKGIKGFGKKCVSELQV